MIASLVNARLLRCHLGIDSSVGSLLCRGLYTTILYYNKIGSDIRASGFVSAWSKSLLAFDGKLCRLSVERRARRKMLNGRLGRRK